MIPSRAAQLFLIAVVCTAVALAQDAPFTVKVDVAMVLVDVAVFNSSGMPVTNLNEGDFRVYEDGRPQQIRTFASSDSAYNMLLVLDRSGSMTSELPFLIQAVNRFMANLRPQDQVAIAAFDDSFDILSPWRSVRSGPRSEIKLGPQGRGTRFYEAIKKIPRELDRVAGRKAVLIYSDGEDYNRSSPEHDDKGFAQAMRAVREAGVPFYFIGVTGEAQPGATAMKQFADASGGHVFLTEHIEDVVPFYDRISRDLGVSYTVGYVSDNPQRGGERRQVEIAVPGRAYRLSQSRDSYAAN